MALDQQEQANSSDIMLRALFARMDTVAMSIATSVVFALGLAAATAVLLVQGAPEGMPVGSNLSALGNILPGYSVTWLGALIGAGWAGLIGAFLGFFAATTWNFAHLVFLGVLALGYPRQVASLPKRMDLNEARSPDEVSEDRRLFSAAARLNVSIAALFAGLALGLLLFLATHVSLGVSDHPGRYLNLFGIFMPGYSASSVGAWFGLLWGLIFGGRRSSAPRSSIKHLIYRIMALDRVTARPQSLVNIWRSSVVACWRAQEIAKLQWGCSWNQSARGPFAGKQSARGTQGELGIQASIRNCGCRGLRGERICADSRGSRSRPNCGNGH